MNLKEVLDKTITFFKQKNFESPRLDAEILLSEGLGLERIQLYLKYDQPLKDQEVEKLRELVRRRSMGEPIAYILGKKEFYKSTFKVTPAVLVPRPETESLVEAACDLLEKKIANSENQFEPMQVLDLGAGSGCISISIAKEFPNINVYAVEKSANAFQVLDENIKVNQCENIKAICEDAEHVESVIKHTAKQFDLIISNPPYIDINDKEIEESVRKFEPAEALFAENHGLYFYQSWLQKYSPYLKSQGDFLFEIGYKQGTVLLNFAESFKFFKEIHIIKDLSGKDRILKITKE